MLNSKRIRHTINDAYNDIFYQMPKFLVENEEFENLSYGAKFLYMLLKDRHKQSLENGWYDREGNIFLIYTRIDMQEMMHVSNKTITKFVTELKKYNLIEEVQQGQGKPNLIYVLAVDIEIAKTCKKYMSRDVESTRLDREKVHAINIYNNNNYINNQSITPKDSTSPACPQDEACLTNDEEMIDGLKTKNRGIDKNVNRGSSKTVKDNKGGIDEKINRIDEDEISNTIKQNIGYNELKSTYPEIEDIHTLMLDVCTSNKKTISISKESIPINKVRDRFLQLNSLHIEYVLECVLKQANIKNLRSYLLTALYNAPTTYNAYYTNKVKAVADIPANNSRNKFHNFIQGDNDMDLESLAEKRRNDILKNLRQAVN